MLKPTRCRGRRGAATLFIAVTMVGLGAMSLSLLAVNVSVQRTHRAAQRDLNAFYAAETGLSLAYQELQNGGDGALGSPGAPIEIGNTSFVVAAEAVGLRTTLTAVGRSDGGVARAEMVLKQVPSGFFQHAAFGDEALTVESNAILDSWNSKLGNYASQYDAVLGYAHAMGNVATNGDMTLLAHTDVFGDASPGPGGDLDDDAPLTNVTGSTAPLVAPKDLPPIVVPAATGVAALTTAGDYEIPSGEYHFPSIAVNGGTTLTIQGPAVVVVDDFYLKATAKLLIDATNGPVEIYGLGDFELKSNSEVSTYASTALDVQIALTGDNHGDGADGSTIALNSQAEFTGTIYAPDASLTIESNFELFGAACADVMTIASNSKVHYDEALATGGADVDPVFETLLWRPVGKK